LIKEVVEKLNYIVILNVKLNFFVLLYNY